MPSIIDTKPIKKIKCSNKNILQKKTMKEKKDTQA